MRRALIVATVTCGAMIAGATAATATAPAADGTGPRLAAGVDTASRVIVGLRAGADSDDLRGRAGARLVHTVPGLAAESWELPSTSRGRALEVLAGARDVTYVEVDSVATVDRTPNDYWWPSQWGPVRVNAPTAWDTTTGSSSVTVAVLDTGVTPAAADLAGKVLPGRDFVNNDSDATDDHGHGTSAAGIVAAASDNSVGVTSLCWECRILPVKVMGADGAGYYSTIASGITYAADAGAKVITLSASGSTSSATLLDAVRYARARGSIVLSSAGNSGCDCPTYPASYSEVLSVGATDSQDAPTSYTNRGAWVDVTAPGTNWTTTRTGGYGTFAGTSSSTPFVAGIAGLLFSAAPAATPTEVEAAIETTAVTVGSIAAHGRVDAAAAVAALAGSSAPAPAGTTTPTSSPTPTASPTPTVTPTPTASSTPTTAPAPTTTVTTFSGSLNSKTTSRSYAQQLAGGSVSGRLTTSKPVTLTLTLLGPDGAVLATATGATPVTVQAPVGSGTHTWVVTGSSRAGFTLSVSATA